MAIDTGERKFVGEVKCEMRVIDLSKDDSEAFEKVTRKLVGKE